MERTRKKFWINRQWRFIYGMLSVALLNFLVFWLYVNVSSISMAFKIPGRSGYTLENFTNFFKEFTYTSSIMKTALRNTIKFFFSGILIIFPASLIFSYFLYKKIFLYKVFRIIFFLPSIISVVVLTGLYSNMVAPKGIVTKIFMLLTGAEQTPILLGESAYAVNTLILYNIWTGFGVNIILFGSAMAKVPEEIIEYGKIEGLGFFREMVQIIFPLIWPTISTVIILNFVGLFNASGPILFLTAGKEYTYTIAYYIFKQVYEPNGALNYAAAIGVFFTMVGLPIVLFVKWVLSKIGPEVEY